MCPYEQSNNEFCNNTLVVKKFERHAKYFLSIIFQNFIFIETKLVKKSVSIMQKLKYTVKMCEHLSLHHWVNTNFSYIFFSSFLYQSSSTSKYNTFSFLLARNKQLRINNRSLFLLTDNIEWYVYQVLYSIFFVECELSEVINEWIYKKYEGT